MYLVRSEFASTSEKVMFVFATLTPKIPTIILAASARLIESFGRKFIFLSVTIFFESAYEMYGAYHEFASTSRNGVAPAGSIVNPAALITIFKNSARVRLLSGLNLVVLFMTHRATRCWIYSFAQLSEISRNLISLSDEITRAGFMKVVVVVAPFTVVVITV